MIDLILKEPLVMEKIVDSIGDGLFILNREGQIVFWNRSMERICGFSASEVVGKSCNLIKCSNCFGRKCPEGINACGILRHGKEELKECTLKHRDGFEVPVIKNSAVIRNENGIILGAVETVTDLTALNQMRLKVAEAERRSQSISQYGKIIGSSSEMQKIYALIDAAASSDATVLIQGESGTGKELVASAIHEASHRKQAAIVTVNCAALPENLLESELFGHTKGAFTGALSDRTGRFEEANGGTLFLDEVGEISPLIQIKLLRVLQERLINRVGENSNRKIDIRVIAATHRNLYEDVKQGKFREDLYYRLKVFPIQLPPLKQRKKDLPLLINHFLGSQSRKTGKMIHGISSEAMRMLLDYSWPGNIRELENAIEHAFVLCPVDTIQLEDLPVEIRDPSCQTSLVRDYNRDRKQRRIKPTKKQLLELLNAMDWNKTEVAGKIGLSRTSVWKYMKKYKIPLKPPGEDSLAKAN